MTITDFLQSPIADYSQRPKPREYAQHASHAEDVAGNAKKRGKLFLFKGRACHAPSAWLGDGFLSAVCRDDK
ncbi:MAG: hypothetical protein C7N36_19490 [Bacteroidetes bacterium]|nr:MAG: hypothetical protein C7N36_19490 [Bacteroidota bacterium]